MKIRHTRISKWQMWIIVLGLSLALMEIAQWHSSDVERRTRDEFNETEIAASARPVLDQIAGLKNQTAMNGWLTTREMMVEMSLANRDGPSSALIKKNQRKEVEWAGNEFQTPISLVYIHGFSASRLELDPVVSQVAAALGANVFFTRLTAHGLTNGEEFAGVRARDWATDVEEAIAIGEKIGRKVIVVAMSTGVPLVLENRMRHKLSDAVAGLVLLSPNYQLRARGTTLLEGKFAVPMARQLIGDYREFKSSSPMHAERWTTRYRVEGVVAMLMAVASVRTLDFSKINIPTLTIYSEQDDVVDVDAIKKRSGEFRAAGSKVIAWPQARRHELVSATFDPEQVPALVDLIANWIVTGVGSAVAADGVSGGVAKK